MAGTVVMSTLSDGTNSTSATNPIRGSARAWINYTGSTQTINNSFNVSSVTYTSTGRYTINFTTAMPNANYVVQISQQQTAAAGTWGQMQVYNSVTTSAFNVTYGTYDAGAFQNPPSAYITVFSS